MQVDRQTDGQTHLSQIRSSHCIWGYSNTTLNQCNTSAESLTKTETKTKIIIVKTQAKKNRKKEKKRPEKTNEF